MAQGGEAAGIVSFITLLVVKSLAQYIRVKAFYLSSERSAAPVSLIFQLLRRHLSGRSRFRQ